MDMDELLRLVGEKVPTFGGFYIDETKGILYVWTIDNDESLKAARDALVELFDEPYWAQFEPVALKAAYPYLRLHQWWHELSPRLGGIIYGGVSSASNRIVVGIANSMRRATVEAEISRQRIPGDAVVLEESAPIRPLGTRSLGG